MIELVALEAVAAAAFATTLASRRTWLRAIATSVFLAATFFAMVRLYMLILQPMV